MANWGAQHLAEVESKEGTGDGSGAIRNLVEVGLKNANDASQKARAEAKGTDEKTYPYVTDAGKCSRQVWFSLQNVDKSETLTTDSLVNFGVGHAVEEWLAVVLEAQGAEIVREYSIKHLHKGTIVSGRVDFIVTLPDFNCLIELKTISSRAMGFMLRQKKPGRDEHRKQLNLYEHFSQLSMINGRMYDVGYLVYVVKDATKAEPTVHAFKVKYDRDMAIADLDNLAEIASMAKKNIDPGIPLGYKKSAYPCTYCDWKTFCWNNKEVTNG